jgi:hypothetical protein
MGSVGSQEQVGAVTVKHGGHVDLRIFGWHYMGLYRLVWGATKAAPQAHVENMTGDLQEHAQNHGRDTSAGAAGIHGNIGTSRDIWGHAWENRNCWVPRTSFSVPRLVRVEV